MLHSSLQFLEFDKKFIYVSRNELISISNRKDTASKVLNFELYIIYAYRFFMNKWSMKMCASWTTAISKPMFCNFSFICSASLFKSPAKFHFLNRNWSYVMEQRSPFHFLNTSLNQVMERRSHKLSWWIKKHTSFRYIITIPFSNVRLHIAA